MFKLFGQPPWRLEPEPELAASDGELIEPTAEEAKNGWTAETLTKYVRQTERAISNRHLASMVPQQAASDQIEAANDWDPFGW